MAEVDVDELGFGGEFRRDKDASVIGALFRLSFGSQPAARLGPGGIGISRKQGARASSYHDVPNRAAKIGEPSEGRFFFLRNGSSHFGEHSMRTLLFAACAAVWVAAPIDAQAEEFSYSYLEAGWIQVDLDGADVKADGFEVGGSVALTDRFFVSGGYAKVSKYDVDVENYSIGAGGSYPLSDRLHLVGAVHWVETQLSSSVASGEDDAYGLSASLRGKPANRFELEAGLTYVDYGDGDDDTLAGLRVRYSVTDKLAVGMRFQNSDIGDLYGLSVRLNFGD